MNRFYAMGVLCPLVLIASLSLAAAQSSTPGSVSSDPSITAISVLGTVTEIKTDLRQVIVTTAAGNQVTVTLSDATEFMRIPPGEKTKDKFIKITSAHLDRAIASLRAAACRRTARPCRHVSFT